ncbi:MAG: hypothetical protein BM563_08395 [Bacteroidetes bacterium MedPE-SWsnd-G1]|nr:MAG: hypothetical protein BM563_08395 [Bacteroidetes bacterium MedPE-SWsnd-G1]
MFIHNETINVDESINEKWLTWMHDVNIPAILETGKFISIKLCHVLVEEDMGGITYAVQYTAANKTDLQQFLAEESYKFKEAEMKLFSGKFGTFATQLKVISEISK